ERVRSQLTTRQGGADPKFDSNGNRIGGALLLAVVTLHEDAVGRSYRLPNDRDYEAVREASNAVTRRKFDMPSEPSPAGGGSGAGRAFSVQKYGMMTFGDLFSERQRIALGTLARITASLEMPGQLRPLIALIVSRLADRVASLVGWDVGGEKLGHV